jgi:hypothetical protein
LVSSNSSFNIALAIFVGSTTNTLT